MSVQRLADDLVAQRLVTTEEAAATISTVGPDADRAALLPEFVRRGVLTPFLVSRIERGETEGLVLGHYKLMYRNASGSFARVYRAQSLQNGSMVGVKVLRQRWAEDPQNVALFHREAELGKKLKHPNITPIYEIGETKGHHWFSMEFVEGGNLRDFIKIRKRLEPGEASRYLLDMARGLEYALRLGFTHRDLKMTNVLLSSTGVAKLIDFGLAGQGADGQDDQKRAVEYATIENNTGAAFNDPRTDLYFLGAIYYELLSGVPPYPRTRDRAERQQINRYRMVRPIRQHVSTLPAAVVDLVTQLMELDPNRRQQTPTELIKQLEPVLLDLGESIAQPGGRGGRLKKQEEQPERLTLMCVETRPKHQDMLREYFTRYGYRVLILGDPDRALQRAERDSPDLVVLMGGSIGADIAPAYLKASKLAAENAGLGVVAVLSEDQTEFEADMRVTETARVLSKVSTLRDLRNEVEAVLKKLGKTPPTGPS